MSKKITLLTLLVCVMQTAFSQNARIQLIHNCADQSADTIDVYRNGAIWFDNLVFRSSTAFVNITGSVESSIDIAPSGSSDVSESFYNFTFTPVVNQKYILVADGIISETGYIPTIPFALHLFTGARELSDAATATDLLLHHGCTDLTEFDLLETNLLQINAFDDVTYSSFRGYEGVVTAPYTFSVQSSNNQYTLANYQVSLFNLGLGNDAITILTSGFVNPHYNSGGASFGLFISLATGGPFVELASPVSQVQLIHNSPDPALASVDIYLNGQILRRDFGFLQATEPFRATASDNPVFDIAPAGSNGVEESFSSFEISSPAGDEFLLVLNGMFNTQGYNPAKPLSLNKYNGALELTPSEGHTGIRVINAATDAPPVKMNAAGDNTNYFNNLAYPVNSDFFELTASDYLWEIRRSTDNSIVKTVIAPLASGGLTDTSMTIITSGFLNPGQNNNGPAFGLWYTTIAGGPLMPLAGFIETPVYSRIQLIHNSADDLADVVDIYANSIKVADDLAFRDATSFFDIEVNHEINFAIAPASSNSADDAFAHINLQFQPDRTYIAVLTGIVSTAGYNPAPAMTLKVLQDARESAVNPGETDLVFFQGSTDLPATDIDEATLPLVELADNLGFGSFSGYESFETSDGYALRYRNNNGDITLAYKSLPLSTLEMQGKSAVIFTSGFLIPANNSNGSPLDLMVALADGSTFPLQDYVGIKESALTAGLILYPNPSKEKIFIKGELQRTSVVLFKVMDSTGQTKDSGTLNESGNLWQINLDKYPAGMYMLELNNGQLSEKVKFSVVK